VKDQVNAYGCPSGFVFHATIRQPLFNDSLCRFIEQGAT
jgi:hypothetical protein